VFVSTDINQPSSRLLAPLLGRAALPAGLEVRLLLLQEAHGGTVLALALIRLDLQRARALLRQEAVVLAQLARGALRATGRM
jgi:hypothetical protein